MCNIDWLLVLEYLKVFLAWPFLLTILIILALVFFQDEIKKFFNVINSRPSKIRFGTVVNIELFDNEIEDEFYHQKQNIINAAKISTDILKTKDIELIRKEIIKLKVSDKEAVDILIDQLASFTSFIKMDNLTKVLFSEQQDLIAEINKQQNGFPINDVEKYLEKWKSSVFDGKYENVKKAMPNYANWKIADFTTYLLNNGLLMEQNCRFYITPIGKAYLAFCAKVGRY